MSKQELQQAAWKGSGVTHQESLEATEMVPSLYDRIGHDGFVELTERFYDKVFEDPEPWFTNIFSSSTKHEAVENQVRCCCQP